MDLSTHDQYSVIVDIPHGYIPPRMPDSPGGARHPDLLQHPPRAPFVIY